METTPSEPGTRRSGFIPLCVPEITGNAWKYIKQCLGDNWVSSAGPFVNKFEKQVAEFVGASHAVAVSSGTAALHTALLVAGVQPDDEVLVSDLTFIASANAIRHAGAWPVFIDAEPHYWQMDPQQVSDFLTKNCTSRAGKLINKDTGRRVRAIMPVHILGHPVDMDPLLELAHKYDLIVVEDAAEALGAEYKENRVGRQSDIACFSFNGNKLITTGGGGVLVTNRSEWAERARYLTTQAKDDPIEYVHHNLGYNYRLTNLQADLGCAQMEVIESYIRKKRAIAEWYTSAFAASSGLRVMQQAPWAYSTHWMFTMSIDAHVYGASSRDLLGFLEQQRIQARPLWQPMHLSPSFADLPKRECPVAEQLYRDALSLPCSVSLSEEEQSAVIRVVQAGERQQQVA